MCLRKLIPRINRKTKNKSIKNAPILFIFIESTFIKKTIIPVKRKIDIYTNKYIEKPANLLLI
jgi:hypothetical protein